MKEKSEELTIHSISGLLFLSWYEIYTAINGRMSSLYCDSVRLLSEGSTTQQAEERWTTNQRDRLWIHYSNSLEVSQILSPVFIISSSSGRKEEYGFEGWITEWSNVPKICGRKLCWYKRKEWHIKTNTVLSAPMPNTFLRTNRPYWWKCILGLQQNWIR